jgi:predicted DNA-binding transcriptional regulator AlpA
LAHQQPASPVLSADDELLTVAELAALLKTKESSIYNLTRKRSVRYAHELPVIRAPFGLRFRKSSVLAWIAAQETSGRAA